MNLGNFDLSFYFTFRVDCGDVKYCFFYGWYEIVFYRSVSFRFCDLFEMDEFNARKLLSLLRNKIFVLCMIKYEILLSKLRLAFNNLKSDKNGNLFGRENFAGRV